MTLGPSRGSTEVGSPGGGEGDLAGLEGDARVRPAADWFELAATARARPRSLRRLPALLAAAFRLLSEAGRTPLLVVMALQVLGASLGAAQVFAGQAALSALLGSAATEAELRPALGPFLLLALATAGAAITNGVLELRQRLLEELATRVVRRRIVAVTTGVDLAVFDRPDFHDQLQRVRIGAVARPLLLAQGFTALVGGLVGAAAVTVALLAVSPLLVPLVLVSGLPLWWASRRQGALEFAFHAHQITEMRRREYLADTLVGRDEAKEVRAFSLAEPLLRAYDGSYDGYERDLRHHLAARQRLTVLGVAGGAVVTSAAIALLLWGLSAGRVGLAETGAALLGIRLLAARTSALLGGLGQMYESSLFFEDLRDFLRHGEGASVKAERPRASAGVSPEGLRVEGVTFRYPGSHADVLHDVTVEIPRGKVVALVGENGSGKTTLAKLLAGLYEPDAGRVLRDGVDLRDLDEDSLRRECALVFQDFVRYQLSATHNIGLGRADGLGDAAGIRRAARLAGADEFLSALPQGYDTVLSKEYPDGVDLSLGQWQRVALARAFFRDAPVVVLDEPSASLDARAEHELFERVRSLLRGRTVVLISHRFSTVRSADLIYVLREGRIVEQGDHEELVARGGFYAELFSLQAAAYLPPVPGPRRAESPRAEGVPSGSAS